MAEIEIILPTVQYGNVKLRATPDELGLNEGLDAYELGVAASVYLNLFVQGFKHGSTLDVSAPQGASPEALEEKVQELLNEGLGGVTELHDEAEEYKNNSDKAPWDNPQVDSKPKPWESGSAAPATKPVVDEGW